MTSPLYPFVGSAVFFSSYGRAVKFWERSYKTNRVGKTPKKKLIIFIFLLTKKLKTKKTDNTQVKLSEALDNPTGSDGNLNNLNSIFYEHLMSSLQSVLYDDIKL